MNDRRILPTALMMVLFLVGTVWGETKKDDPAAFTLDDVVVTADKIEEYIRNYPRMWKWWSEKRSFNEICSMWKKS